MSWSTGYLAEVFIERVTNGGMDGLTRMDEFPGTTECAMLLKATADPTRLSILHCLIGGERSVTNLARALELPQPAVSHHLAILRRLAVLLVASILAVPTLAQSNNLHPPNKTRVGKLEGGTGEERQDAHRESKLSLLPSSLS